MNRSAILFLLPLVAGCNVRSANSSDDNVSIEANGNGDVALNFPFAKAQIKLPPSVIQKGQFDIDGVRMIPGGAMTGFHLDSANDLSNVNMNFTAPQSPEQVRSYFLDQFHRKGVEAALSGDSVNGRSKDGDTFKIEVTPASKGSQGKIVIHSKD